MELVVDAGRQKLLENDNGTGNDERLSCSMCAGLYTETSKTLKLDTVSGPFGILWQLTLGRQRIQNRGFAIASAAAWNAWWQSLELLACMSTRFSSLCDCNIHVLQSSCFNRRLDRRSRALLKVHTFDNDTENPP